MERIRQKLASAADARPVRDVSLINIVSSDEETGGGYDRDNDGLYSPDLPIPHVGSVLGSSFKPQKLTGEGGISMPEPHPYRPPSGPGAPFKPPTMLATPSGGGVTEDADGEKFNVDVGGDDFKTNPDDAQRALKELVEGAIGTDLEGIDMKDATVKGFRPGITLMPHQIQGRAWMRERETGKKCGGILADDMGLGKTIQTLTRIVEGKPTEEDVDDGYTGGTLIICPVGLIAQWESEIKKMCLKVRTISHHGPSRAKDSKVLEAADVVITSYQVVSSEHAAHLGGASSSAAKPKKATTSKAKKRIESDNSGLSSDSDGGAPVAKKSAGSKKPKPAALFGDAQGEKFNIEVDGEDFKTNPDDAQRALKELVEGAIGATDLEGIDMKDATVKGFREGIKLMPHQIQGRAWMRERETGKKCGGILADDMGLGKTIQTLTRIVEGRPTEEDLDDGYNGGTLIVCPVGLIAQWESEIKKMCLKVRTISHHGASRTKDSRVLQGADVVITSYQVVSSEHAAYQGGAASSAAKPKKATTSKAKKRVESDDSGLSSDSDGGAPVTKKAAGSKKPKPAALFGVRWWRIVLDEAQNIKNRTTKAALACCALRGRNKWCLTGTPIQNSVEELYSLFKFLGVRPLNDWDQFRTTIAQPVKQGRSTRAMKRLHVVLKAVMLRRTKDMTINGAPLLNLPGRNVQTVMCQFDEDELAFYKALEQKTELTLNKFIRAGTVMKNYTSVLLLLLRLRQACDHPSLVSKDFQKDADAVESRPAKKDDEEEEEDALADLFQKMGVEKRTLNCAICQTELPANAGEDEKHCDDCAANIAAQSRRKSIATKSGLPPSSAKIRRMIEILEEIDERSEGDDKTIVFSQFTTMLDLIEPFLKDAGIGYSRLDGSMVPKDREVALEKIRNSSRTKVILISFKAGSTGLNLTACNNVILVDLWWNPALEDQAFDRAHRLGQTKDVHIYKLTIPETVEERILKLQDAKRDLAKAALSGDKLSNNKLRLDDIMKLFNKREHEDSDED
ncbi:unnamed protein product [Rhizoctonia solani]|uniref:Uncharacterized protein n=1 Tax=Rhizoctonia solani TaxID=456999 RepID=A0A8H3CJT4_9AGAM|nr:unnamed protein product [Rhizoctonia solani]